LERNFVNQVRTLLYPGSLVAGYMHMGAGRYGGVLSEISDVVGRSRSAAIHWVRRPNGLTPP
jgi:hypothetical protein